MVRNAIPETFDLPSKTSRRNILGGFGSLAALSMNTVTPQPAWAEEAAAGEDEGATPVAAASAAADPPPSQYEIISASRDKMGGALEPYADVTKGWRIYKPYSWTQYEQSPGLYEMKVGMLEKQSLTSH